MGPKKFLWVLVGMVLGSVPVRAQPPADPFVCNPSAARTYIAGWVGDPLTTQGTRTNGTPVVANRSNPNAMLGAPQGLDNASDTFYSLGFGGEATLVMGNEFANIPGPDLEIFETTFGNPVCNSYPERAQVWASQDGVDWVELTTPSTPICLNAKLDLGPLPWAKFIRVRDVSNPPSFLGIVDGYDIDGIVGLSACNVTGDPPPPPPPPPPSPPPPPPPPPPSGVCPGNQVQNTGKNVWSLTVPVTGSTAKQDCNGNTFFVSAASNCAGATVNAQNRYNTAPIQSCVLPSGPSTYQWMSPIVAQCAPNIQPWLGNDVTISFDYVSCSCNGGRLWDAAQSLCVCPAGFAWNNSKSVCDDGGGGGGGGGDPDPTPPVSDPPEWDETFHRCDGGSAAGVLVSPVSTKVSGDTDAKRFGNSINKQVACCNHFADSGRTKYSTDAPTNINPYEKFDCKERPENLDADFNTLWASTSDGKPDGQPNAIVLSNSLGQHLTGFYTLDMRRCDQFSEMSQQPLQPGAVNPQLIEGIQQDRVIGGGFRVQGAPIPKLTGDSWNNLVNNYSGVVPNCEQNPELCRQCPILVRAAIVARCPRNPLATPGSAKSSYLSADGVRHCAIAESLQVRLRMEQIYEITGTPKIKTVDTTQDLLKANWVSIQDLIR